MGDHIGFGPMRPEFRRWLLNAAKNTPRCSDEVIGCLHDSECLVYAPVTFSTDPIVKGSLCRIVADEILLRFTDCLRLYGNATPFDLRQCWFQAAGNAMKVEWKTLTLLEPNWRIPPESLHSVPHAFEGEGSDDVDVPFEMAQAEWVNAASKIWPRCSSLCEVDRIITLCDKGNLQACTKSGIAYGKEKAEQYTQERVASLSESGERVPISVPSELTVQWLINGFNRAFLLSVRDLQREHYSRTRPSRLQRGFQFFALSFDMKRPFNYIALVSALEALFGSNDSELSFQIAARASWFLYAHESRTFRTAMAYLLKDFYDLRSKVVHGSKYDSKKMDGMYRVALSQLRRTLIKIAKNDRLYDLFSSSRPQDEKRLSAFLKGLSLGQLDLPKQREEAPST